MANMFRLWAESSCLALIVPTALGLATMSEAPASAHPGGLNAQGGHNNRETGDYHCHESSADAAPQQQRQTSRPTGSGRGCANCSEA
jgi:hypothetical protein